MEANGFHLFLLPKMKAVIIFLLFTLSLNGQHQVAVDLLDSSTLKINGKTNINSFECTFDSSKLQRTNKIRIKPNGDKIEVKNAQLRLNHTNFDCGHRRINNDFKALIKSDEYPDIKIDLLEIHNIKDSEAAVKVKINIAGKSKNYNFPIEICNLEATEFQSRWVLNIRDFDLTPPKKAFGIIVIDEEIEIDFLLKTIIEFE